MVDLDVINCQAYFLHISIRLFVNLPWIVQVNLDFTIVDHVVNHGLTMAEVGRRVQPNIGRSTVSSIIQTFRRENRYVNQCAMYCYIVYLL